MDRGLIAGVEPRTTAGAAGLAAILADPARALIASDFDGTLAPIVADPDRARAHPLAGAALRRLAARVGTLAVVTGRPAATAVAYGGLAEVPGIVVLGLYGRERWAAGELTVPEVPPAVEAARARLPGVLAAAGAPDGTWVEDKGGSLAVHTRTTADPEAALVLLRRPLAELAEALGLLVEPGRMVLELRPPGSDKRVALRDLATRRAAGSVLYCGDDLGDLAAFDAVEELRAEGVRGVTVCASSAEVRALAERADLVVPGPEGVVALLTALADAIEAV